MKIAIVKLSAMGDIVHSMVVLQVIKKYRPDIKIDWYVDERFYQIVSYNKDIENIYSLSLKSPNKLKSLFKLVQNCFVLSNKKKYDLIIDLQGLLKSALLTYFLPSKDKAGFSAKSCKEPISAIFYNKKFEINYSENVILRNILLATNILGIRFKFDEILKKDPFLFFDKKYAIPSFASGKKVLIIPSASFKSKEYPYKNYREIIKSLNAVFFICWGSEYEKELATKISTGNKNSRVIDKINLMELKSLISQMDLVIGGDTGPLHIAWALNIPSIGLFGPTPYKRNFLETEINIPLHSGECIDLNRIQKQQSSIQSITVDKVCKIAKKFLED